MTEAAETVLYEGALTRQGRGERYFVVKPGRVDFYSEHAEFLDGKKPTTSILPSTLKKLETSQEDTITFVIKGRPHHFVSKLNNISEWRAAIEKALPPTPHNFHANKTITTMPASQYIVTGAGNLDGTYSLADVAPGPDNGNYPIYEGRGQYMYFWQPLGYWRVGPDHLRAGADLAGKGYSTPPDIDEWRLWDEKQQKWVRSAIRVVEPRNSVTSADDGSVFGAQSSLPSLREDERAPFAGDGRDTFAGDVTSAEVDNHRPSPLPRCDRSSTCMDGEIEVDNHRPSPLPRRIRSSTCTEGEIEFADDGHASEPRSSQPEGAPRVLAAMQPQQPPSQCRLRQQRSNRTLSSQS